jgi:hypothetical protein
MEQFAIALLSIVISVSALAVLVAHVLQYLTGRVLRRFGEKVEAMDAAVALCELRRRLSLSAYRQVLKSVYAEAEAGSRPFVSWAANEAEYRNGGERDLCFFWDTGVELNGNISTAVTLPGARC